MTANTCKILLFPLGSPSREIAVVAKIISRDATLTTGMNILNLKLETNLSMYLSPLALIKSWSQVEPPAPGNRKFFLFDKYLKLRNYLDSRCEKTEPITELIDRLCSS